jgi:urease accessory protein
MGMPDCPIPPTAHQAANWHASLHLQFARAGNATRLARRSHSGPLRVQKALYPEGESVCHAIVIHPPGGVAGGDSLSIEVQLAAGAHALLSTPGAAKWYRANGKLSRQALRLSAGTGATIEWLPQESIFYNQAQVLLDQQVELAAGASFIGCDIACFGRRAAGESFTSGSVRQHMQIRLDGKLIWSEQGGVTGEGPLMASPLGLAGHSVCVTLVAVGKPADAALLAALRAIGPALELDIGVSQLKSLLVLRCLCDDSEVARKLVMAAWALLRPHLLGGRAAQVPRIWNT